MDVRIARPRALRRLAAALAAALVAAIPAKPAAAQVNTYIVGPQDVLAIALFDDESLGGKYTVEADGTFTFPLIGRVEAGGLTLREVEEALRKALSNGFFRRPQVSVAIEQYRSQRVFVVGEVRTPGAYSIMGEMTLIEALARAGSTTEHAAWEALIVRSTAGAPAGPVLPEQHEDAEVVRVDLRALQRGESFQNVTVRDNDTVVVPRAELVYVYGQVKGPGAYAIKGGTTVLQALSLAGGVTDRGATSRIRIARVVEGKKVEEKVGLDDVVRPGDTIIVPERFF